MSETFDLTNPKKPTIDKDPNAVLDYTWDLAAWLDAIPDTLASHQIVVNGVTLDSSTINGKTVVAWLSGGIAGEKATATCRFTTTGGRTDDRTIYLKIVER